MYRLSGIDFELVEHAWLNANQRIKLGHHLKQRDFESQLCTAEWEVCPA